MSARFKSGDLNELGDLKQLVADAVKRVSNPLYCK